MKTTTFVIGVIAFLAGTVTQVLGYPLERVIHLDLIAVYMLLIGLYYD